MMTSRKLLVAFLCPLFVVASVMLIQGCGGGSQTDEAAETAAEAAETTTEAVETTTEAVEAPEESKPALEAHTEDLAIAGYACSMCPTEVALEAGKCGSCGMDLEKANVHYTCADCGGSKLKPGKCACGKECALAAVADAHAGHDH